MFPQAPSRPGPAPPCPPASGTILVAADFSEGSRQAFRIACSLARQGGARLLVLHVVEPPLVLNESGPSFPAAAGDGNRLAALEEQLRGSGLPANSTDLPCVERAAREGQLRGSYVPDSPLDAAYLVRDGNAAEVILREAEGSRCDLIVLGTHGRTGLRRLLVGSVAEAVLRRATCPVLTVSAIVPAAVAPDAATWSVIVP
jgi:nucleotide-binding universal stress UspA family protein